MSGIDRLTLNDLEYWAEYGDYDVKLMVRELLAHRRASQAASGGCGYPCGYDCNGACFTVAMTPSDTDREWLIALLTHDQGELLDAYGVGAEVRQSDPELHGFAAAQGDAILERLSQSSELAQIDAMLMEGQGDDDGDQVLPDFEPGWSVAAKVEACLHLLEKRRDLIAATAPSDGLREAALAERERIATALEAEADVLPCAEDAAVTRSNAALIRADFSYYDMERAALSTPTEERQ